MLLNNNCNCHSISTKTILSHDISTSVSPHPQTRNLDPGSPRGKAYPGPLLPTHRSGPKCGVQGYFTPVPHNFSQAGLKNEGKWESERREAFHISFDSQPWAWIWVDCWLILSQSDSRTKHSCFVQNTTQVAAIMHVTFSIWLISVRNLLNWRLTPMEHHLEFPLHSINPTFSVPISAGTSRVSITCLLHRSKSKHWPSAFLSRGVFARTFSPIETQHLPLWVSDQGKIFPIQQFLSTSWNGVFPHQHCFPMLLHCNNIWGWQDQDPPRSGCERLGKGYPYHKYSLMQ